MKDYKIYMYTNRINGKVYVGQTRRTLKLRAGSNGAMYRPCTVFYRAIVKYGWENFEPTILAGGLSKEEANELEKYYISKYDSCNHDCGYNISNGGSEQEYAYKEVYCYELNGEYIRSYKSLSDASVATGINIGHISQCCNGIYKSAGGFIWSYEKNDFVEPYNINTTSKRVYQYSLDGYLINEYNSAIAAANALCQSNLDKGNVQSVRSCICGCCRGENISSYGFQWRYDKFDKIEAVNPSRKIGVAILQYSTNGKFIAKYDNLIAASESIGDNCAYNSICACLNKRQKTACGYIWIYDGEDLILSDYKVYEDRKKRILQRSINGELINEYDSMSDAAKSVNGFVQNISKCVNGKYKTAYGYKWEYAL